LTEHGRREHPKKNGPRRFFKEKRRVLIAGAGGLGLSRVG